MKSIVKVSVVASLPNIPTDMLSIGFDLLCSVSMKVHVTSSMQDATRAWPFILGSERVHI